LSNQTVWETIILNHCGEGWSRWTLEHSVQHDHISPRWWVIIVTQTFQLLHILRANYVSLLCAIINLHRLWTRHKTQILLTNGVMLGVV